MECQPEVVLCNDKNRLEFEYPDCTLFTPFCFVSENYKAESKHPPQAKRASSDVVTYYKQPG